MKEKREKKSEKLPQEEEKNKDETPSEKPKRTRTKKEEKPKQSKNSEEKKEPVIMASLLDLNNKDEEFDHYQKQKDDSDKETYSKGQKTKKQNSEK